MHEILPNKFKFLCTNYFRGRIKDSFPNYEYRQITWYDDAVIERGLRQFQNSGEDEETYFHRYSSWEWSWLKVRLSEIFRAVSKHFALETQLKLEFISKVVNRPTQI